MLLAFSEIYTLQKAVWTEEDFDKMSWHDVYIHALTFGPRDREFILDIDYMFAWVEAEPPNKHYSFWMSPATLVFKTTVDFRAQLEDPLGLRVMRVTRKTTQSGQEGDTPLAREKWDWTIELLQGEISFSSVGFTQHIRRPPIRAFSQEFSLKERGGISFARSS